MRQEGGKAGRFGDCSEILIGACIEVHRHVGPGLLESAYEQCLCHELTEVGLAWERQKMLPVRCKGLELSHGYRLDLLAVGLLVNFHAPTIKHGLRRLTTTKILPVFPPSCDPEGC